MGLHLARDGAVDLDAPEEYLALAEAAAQVGLSRRDLLRRLRLDMVGELRYDARAGWLLPRSALAALGPEVPVPRVGT